MRTMQSDGELGLRLRPLSAVNVAAAAWLFDLEREFAFAGDGAFETERSPRNVRLGLSYRF